MTTTRQILPITLILLVVASFWAMIGLPSQITNLEMPSVSFVGYWTVITAAIMLPSFALTAVRYVHSIESRHLSATLWLIGGYLSIWSLTAIFAVGIRGILLTLLRQSPEMAVFVAAFTFAITGLYQFSPLKIRSLTIGRLPFSQMLTYASWTGSGRHFRAGAHQGIYSIGCCWALMLLLWVFGLTNVAGMILIALVIAGEKFSPCGKCFAYAVGVVCLILAVAVMGMPGLAPGILTPQFVGM